VTGADGRELPLVKSEQTLFEATEPTPPSAPPFWLPYYLILGIAIGGAAFGLGATASKFPAARIGFVTISWIWVLLTGLGGLVLAGLWGLTDHTAAYNNENVLQVDWLALPLLWLLPRLVWGSSSARKPALILASGVAVLSLLGLLLKLLPQFYQVNGAVIALALPVHAGVAAGIWSLLRTQEPRTRRKPSRASG
jgi:hypothetical protein